MKKVLVLAAALAMVACGGQKEVSFNTLEEAKQTARANALWNAQKYRTENVKLQGWDIVSRGDSTQMPKCPQGDGWATVEFVSSDKKTTTKVKCSTVSAATGCLEDSDFKTKPFAGQDGSCQPESVVPFPIPSIAK